MRVRCGDAVWLEVEDNGIGMEEADRELVFERFYRVLGTGTEGSGLGLAIVREIAEQHDALIRVGSSAASTDAQRPGTLISVEFEALDASQPTVDLSRV